jgi:7-alpha-hydroxysteroid dehydrogenase
MILDLFKVTDKVAIVTGAGRGVGAGIATALAEVGADVVVAARSVDQIEETAVAVRATGRRALAVPTDVTDRAQLEHLVDATIAEFGRLDIVVNNAGGWPPQPLLRTSERAFEDAFRFNVTSAFLMTRFAVPHMVATAGGGVIINISSRAASMVQPGFTSYGTSKAAMSFMTRQMAPELAPKVRVNAIELGGVETDALASVLTDESIRHQLEDNTPMRRVGQVEDIAAFAVYLASPASSWVTGKVFEIDGGVEHPAFTVPYETL